MNILDLKVEQFQHKDEVIVLWYHECCRVFQDRLINDTDRQWFDDLLRHKISTDFGSNPDVSVGQSTILYGDFLNPQTDVRLYIHITDMEQVCISDENWFSKG